MSKRIVLQGNEAWDVVFAGLKALQHASSDENNQVSGRVEYAKDLTNPETDVNVLTITATLIPRKKEEPYKEGDWKEDATKS